MILAPRNSIDLVDFAEFEFSSKRIREKKSIRRKEERKKERSRWRERKKERSR